MGKIGTALANRGKQFQGFPSFQNLIREDEDLPPRKAVAGRRGYLPGPSSGYQRLPGLPYGYRTTEVISDQFSSDQWCGIKMGVRISEKQ